MGSTQAHDRMRRGGGARRTQPRGSRPGLPDNSPYLSRRQHARKVGDRMNRPAHLRMSFLGLALLGGIGGTAAREAISLAVPEVDGIPVAIFAVNIGGASSSGSSSTHSPGAAPTKVRAGQPASSSAPASWAGSPPTVLWPRMRHG